MTTREATATVVLGALAVILIVHYFHGGTSQVHMYLNWLLTGRDPAGGSYFHDRITSKTRDTPASSTSSSSGGFLDPLGDLLKQLQATAPPARMRPGSTTNPAGSQTSSGGTVIANP